MLQWRHLLSLVEGDALRDLRTQILADGRFHVFIYLVMAAGLWLLRETASGIGNDDAGRILRGDLILGSGCGM